MKFDIVKKPIVGLSHTKAGFAISKASPEILLGTGIGLIVIGGVMACKATLAADDILNEAAELNDKVKRAAELGEDAYPEETQIKDKLVILTQSGFKMIKLYAPAMGVAALGVGSILVSHKVISGRYLGMAAAYKTIDNGYKAYRSAVVSELGDEADRRFKHGIVKKEADIPTFNKEGNETGKTKKKTVETVPDIPEHSEYARFFDSSCEAWTKNPDLNKSWLISQQNAANDMLHSRGHLFLNEVYDMLGFDRTEAGTAVGWVDGLGDSYVDFGIFDIYNEAGRRFVNGFEPVILLDFNVDGPIYDKI